MSEVGGKSENVENVVKDVEEGLSIRKSGAKWDVPRSTLQDRLSGRYSRSGEGQVSVITPAKEKRLASWLVVRSKRGLDLSINEFLDSFKVFLDKDQRTTPSPGNRPGRKWCRGLLQRNPMVNLRSARPLEKKRYQISAEDLDKWFAGYEEFLKDNGLAEKPSRI